MSTDTFHEADLQNIKAVLEQHLADKGLSEEEIDALARDLSAARPALQDLVTEQDIADRMYWTIASARTYRAKHRDTFPAPLARRVLWLRKDIDKYFEQNWKSGNAAGS